MRTATIKAAVLAIGLSGMSLYGQPPAPPTQSGGTGGSGSSAPPAAKAKTAPGSLEEQLAAALKHNADIQLSEAKLRESEAELNRTRRQVLGRVSALYAEVQAYKESLKALQEVLKLQEEAFKQGAAPLAVGVGARSNVAKAQIDLAKAEGELQLVIGKVGASQVRSLSEFTLAFELKDNGGGVCPRQVQSRAACVSCHAVPAAQGRDYSTIFAQTLVVQQPMADRVRKLLDTPVKISEFRDEKILKEALDQFWVAAKIDVPLRFLATSVQNQKVQLMAGELPIGAWLQMFEDSVPELRLVVREYGILAASKDRVPPEAVTVQDFWKRKQDSKVEPNQPILGAPLILPPPKNPPADVQRTHPPGTGKKP